MGLILSRRNLKKPPQVVMIGLDSAGKSTLLYKMKLGKTIETQPTVGFNVAMLQVKKKTDFTIWDVGGQGRMRPNWKYYLEGTKALVFVVDSSDRGRMREAKKALRTILGDDNAKGIPLMVLANKQDLPNVMTIYEVARELDLARYSDRHWEIQACSARSNLGLQQVLSSIAKLIKS
ncbi:ADP-ribosylation factor-like protein 11-like [Scleropages formosus]|uniref:ADP-ribosylation factor-like protein 11 n=2 Tax=Scleropages formosus TaxID=113540 RepID=A0A0P7TRV9_SCLFO|nr:ADP-ribosylation factor-like protein 11-like [Scleropages formosus]